eukprot:1154822-Pelagomonas_calceolata.AAC.2
MLAVRLLHTSSLAKYCSLAATCDLCASLRTVASGHSCSLRLLSFYGQVHDCSMLMQMFVVRLLHTCSHAEYCSFAATCDLCAFLHAVAFAYSCSLRLLRWYGQVHNSGILTQMLAVRLLHTSSHAKYCSLAATCDLCASLRTVAFAYSCSLRLLRWYGQVHNPGMLIQMLAVRLLHTCSHPDNCSLAATCDLCASLHTVAFAYSCSLRLVP